MVRMSYERDVRAFDERAADYQDGVLGRLHRDVADRAADVALRSGPAPARVQPGWLRRGQPGSS